MEKLTCSTCKQTLPLEQFSPNSYNKRGYQSQCKDCRRKYITEYRKNPEIREKIRQDNSLRSKAAWELVRRHHDEFLEIVEAIREDMRSKGKATLVVIDEALEKES